MSKNPYITEDLEFLAETVEKFAQKYIAPGFLERDQSRVFDRELVKKMGRWALLHRNFQNNTAAKAWGVWLLGSFMKRWPKQI
ncbi:hypothetical protein QJS67_06540 [Acinetobacter radioresistens]|nr:hypothetical protein QJS67_06540 [Acinetobacter radioresistens]